MGDTANKPPVNRAAYQRDYFNYFWNFGIPAVGLGLYLTAHHMAPSALILPGILLAIAIPFLLWKYRDLAGAGLWIASVIALFANFGDGMRALSSGTWDSALSPVAAMVASCPAGAVSSDNADSLIGQQAIIEGNVVSTNYASSSRGAPTFLDFHDPYQGHFIVVIWGDYRSNFSKQPEETYRNQHVCVSGTVQAYAGSSEIVVETPGQIQIVR